MKRKLFICLAAFHLLFIIISNLYTSYTSYCDYYEKPVDSSLRKCISIILGNQPLCYYAKYTGTSAGYGYFAPNVRSPTSLSCIYRGGNIGPELSSNEASLRYDNLVGALVENINAEKMPVLEQEKKAFETKKKYNELVLRNIAMKMFNDYQLPPDAVSMSLNFINHTPLADARAGKEMNNGLHKVQELTLIIKQ
jgi:hypothetical protein